MDRLHPDDLRELAHLIAIELAELQQATPSVPRLVSVKALARELDVSPSFIYEHAVDLGGVKLSPRPKAPWRFDPEKAREKIAEFAPKGVWQPPPPHRTRRPAKSAKPATTASGYPLLPYKEKPGSILSVRGPVPREPKRRD